MNLKILGVIPARGGSKGVPKKNIRMVGGVPLIVHSILAARESKLLTECIVDTDNEEIANISTENGAKVVMRPSELAQDDTPIIETIKHLLHQYEKKQVTFDAVVLLQPTSPIRTGKNIDEAISLLMNPDTDGVISVVRMEDTHPARMYSLDANQWMHPLYKDLETTRRQDLQPVYYRNGCIYAVKTGVLFKENSLMPHRKKAYIMPVAWLANIDDERDLLIADVLVTAWKTGKI